MRFRFPFILFARAAAVAWLAVQAPALSGQPSRGTEAPAVNPRVADVASAVNAGAPAEDMVKWFSDPDEQVRAAAYGGLLALKINEPATLAALMEAAEREMNPRAREQAYSVADSLNLMPANRQLARDKAFTGRLYHAFRGSDPRQRREAVLVLGAIEAKDAAARDVYVAAIKDPDLSVRLAAVRSIAHVMSRLQGYEEEVQQTLATLLIDVFANDATLRDRAGLALFAMAGDGWATANPQFNQVLDTLINSQDPVDRGIAAVIRRRMEGGDTPADPALTARLLQEAVRHPHYWVRAGATDALSRSPRTFPTDGYQILFDMIDDPDPVLAGEAALRLSGALPLNLPNFSWGWAERNLIVPPTPRQTVPWADADVKLLESDQPEARLQGLKAIHDTMEKSHPSQAQFRAGAVMPLIVERFDDPDPRVSASARQTAQAALKHVVAEGQRRTSTTAPTTPATPRPTEQ